VGQAERGEPRERHDVGAEPDDHVEQFDAGLQDTGRTTTGTGQQAEEGQHERCGRKGGAECRQPVHAAVPPARDQARGEEEQRAGNAGRCVERE